MNRNQLDQLADMTVVVADTGDLQSIEKYKPRDATTNPSLIIAAAKMPEYETVVSAALQLACDEMGTSASAVTKRAADRLAVEFGKRILALVAGRVSTEVDARLSHDSAETIAKARQLIGFYEEASISRQRVLIKIAATWEGIHAAEVLEKEGIHCNLTLLFGLHQAIACAQANVTLISPFVGRILDWHLQHGARKAFSGAEDPGVKSVTRIYEYFKKFGYQTEIMGASFRSLDQIVCLAGCDLLTISPKFLNDLRNRSDLMQRRLDPDMTREKSIERIAMDETLFRVMHEQDRMATDKLHEGIQGFIQATVELEQLLADRLVARENR